MKKIFLHFVVFFCISWQYQLHAQINLNTSLTACYALDANAIDPVNSLSGTVAAVFPTFDRFNTGNAAMSFTGSSISYIQLPNSALIQPTNAITFATWIKLGALTTNQYVVFTKNNSTSNFEAYAMAIANTGSGYKFRVHKGDGSGTTTYTDAVTSLSVNTWYHAAFTMDNSAIKVYVNGVLENTIAVSYGFNYQSGKNVILGGSNESTFNLPLFGNLDNVKFYNRVLSSTEIAALYSSDPNCANYVVSNISNSLSACYALNGNGTEPISNLTATLSAVTSTVDRNNVTNAAIQLSGSSSSQLILPDNPLIKPANAISFSAWIKPISNSNAYILFTKNSLSSNFEAYNLCLDPSAHFMTRKCGPLGTNQVTSPSTVTPNLWYHVVSTIDNSAVKLYVNGVLQGTASSTFNGFDFVSGKNVILGGTNESYNAPFSGSIDNARFYNRTLSAAEVLYLYTQDPTCITNTLVPNSVFIPATTVVCVGSAVSFSDVSTNSPTSWNWLIPGATNTISTVQNPSAVFNTPGVFVASLTAANVNGSGNTYTQTITVSASPTIAIAASNTSVCSGQSISLIASGASTYTWSNNSNAATLTQSPTSNTVFSVSGQNSLGCVSSASINITVNSVSPIIIASTSNTLCEGQSAFVLASGASSYTWNTGAIASAISVTPNITTNYTVSASNSLGCVASATTAITVYSLPIVSLNNGTICAGNVFTFVPSGANSYTIAGGSYTVSPASTGNYTLIGSSLQSCMSSNTATATLSVNAMPTVNVNSGFACVGNAYTLVPTGASFYTIVPGGSTIVNPTSNTNYTVFGSNGNACVANAVANVAVVAPPLLSITAPSIICIGNNASLVANGANLYNWNTGASTSSIVVSPSVNTTYSVTGANLFGCVSTSTFALNVSNVPTIAVNSGSICMGNAFAMLPTGAISYTYSSGTSIVNPIANTNYTVIGSTAPGCISAPVVSSVIVQSLPSITVNSGAICLGSSFSLIPGGGTTYTITGGASVVSPLVNTNYTVTGAGAGSCTNSAVASITVNALPNVSISSPSAICVGNSAGLSGNGAISYTWSTGSNSNSITVSPSTNSVYSLQGTNANGCSNTASVNLTVNPLPSITVSSGSICLGKSYTISASGALTFTFSGGSNVVAPGSTTTYTVSGTNAQACVSSPVVSTVFVLALPNVSVNSGSICSGNVFTLNASGASTYVYSSGSNTVSPSSNSAYTVIGTAANSCSNTAIANVSVNALPILSISSPTGICLGATANLSVSGAATYTWSTGSNSASLSVSPGSTSIYSVSGTAANTCVNSTTVSLIVNALPSISVNSGSICLGKSFTIVPGGATTYTIAGGSFIVSPLLNTSYSVTGTNANGCVAATAATAVITVAALPTVAVNSGSICSGQTFTIIPSGANAYTVAGASNIVNPSATTAYTVIGANANGCVSANTATAIVTVFSLPTITAANASICAGQSYTIVPSGASSYTYSGGSNVVSPNSTTIYSVSGTNTSGCTALNAATLNVVVNPLPTVSVANASICSGQAYTIAPSGASTYSIQGGSFVVNPTANSTYTIIGLSTASCLASQAATVSITVYSLPTITVAGGTICAGQQFTLSPSGATSYTYSSGSALVSPSTSTMYSVTGTNANNCSSAISATAFITVNPSPSITVSNATICAGQSFTLQPLGAVSYTYQGGSAVINPTANATFTISGSSNLGCVSLQSATAAITVNALPIVTVNSGSICVGQSFTVSPAGAQTYSITGGNFVVNPSSNSTYTVTGTGSQACISQPVISTITVFALPQLSMAANPANLCVGETTTLTVSGASSYTWNNGSNQSTIVSSPTVSTIYSLSAMNANGCVNNGSISVQVDACLGLNEKQSSPMLMIYPNPSEGVFYLRLQRTDGCELTVYNVLGEIIYSMKELGETTVIDLSSFMKGIYIFEIKDQKNRWLQKTIIE